MIECISEPGRKIIACQQFAGRFTGYDDWSL